MLERALNIDNRTAQAYSAKCTQKEKSERMNTTDTKKNEAKKNEAEVKKQTAKNAEAKITTAEATAKNMADFTEALNSADVKYRRSNSTTTKKNDVLFSGNVASVTSRSVRVFIKQSFYDRLKENSEERNKKNEPKYKALVDIVASADLNRAGVHATAVTLTTKQYKAFAEAVARLQKQSEAEAKKSEAPKQSEAEEQSEEAKSAAK